MAKYLPVLLALGNIVFGTSNTILTKYQNRQSYLCENGTYTCEVCPEPPPSAEEGECIDFEQPFFQALFTFVGESFCLIILLVANLIKRCRKPRLDHDFEELPAGKKVKGWNYLLFAIPASFDVIGTSMMNIGLVYTHASVYQMLRGFIVVFTATMAVLILKRKKYLYHWLGITLVVAGVGTVGLVSILMNDEQTEPAKNPIVGDILVIAAQLFLAGQMVAEEKVLSQFDVHPLEVVGYEGVAGIGLITILLVTMQFTLGTSRDIGNMFDIKFALVVFADFLKIMIPSFIVTLGYTMTNMCGVWVTKLLGATARTTIEQTRTLSVWLIGLALGWEVFLWPQIIGFVVLVIGAFIYNHVITVPCLYYPPEEKGYQPLPGIITESEDDSASFKGDRNSIN